MIDKQRTQVINMVMDTLIRHEEKLSDGFFYYLPLDEEAIENDMEPDDAQRVTLWHICQEIVEVVMGENGR